MEGPGCGVCVVCGEAGSGSLVSLHASLIAQNGSIHSQMGQVVGVDQLQEACMATEAVCSICLRLLLSIVNLECKVGLLKDEFRATFLQGTNARRQAVRGGQALPDGHTSPADLKGDEKNPSQDEAWNNMHLEPCVKSETGDRFFSNIPLHTTSDLSLDTTQVPDFLVKHESVGGESSAVTSQQSGEALDTSAELRDLLPPHCLGGDATPPCGSQAVEVTLREAVKAPHCEPSTQDPTHSLSSAATCHTAAETVPGGGGGEACSTSSPEDTQGSDGDGGEDDDQTGHGRIRRPQGPAVERTPKRRRRQLPGVLETVQVKAETQEHWLPGDCGTTQLAALLVSCELCGGRFSDAAQLGGHRREAHAATYCHTCAWCPNTCYREKSKLTQHLRRIHDITAHQCPGCGHQAVSQNALDQHVIRQHPESRFFECHICHKAFRTHRYLHFVHIKRCHLGLPIKYSCDKCHKGFVDKSSFENHKVTHSEARNFTCEFCGAGFLTPYALKVHVNTHTQEKKYQCGDCGSAFLRMCNLCAHRKRFHSSSDVKLVCEICGKSTATRKDLRRHQAAQHATEKPFRCPVCGRTYSAKESLKTHLRTHTGERPYVCGCGKAFHKSTVLRRHQRCVHQGQEPQRDAAAAAVDSVQVGGEGEAGREEHLVVITLKECHAPAVYSVQGATPHLQEILVSSEGAGQGHADPPMLTEGPDGLPLLHPALGRGRLALATPVLLASLAGGPITVPDTPFASHLTTTTLDATFPAHPHTLQPQPRPQPQPPTTVPAKAAQALQDPLGGLAQDSCTDLLHLPGLHAGAATAVSLVAPWPSTVL